MGSLLAEWARMLTHCGQIMALSLPNGIKLLSSEWARTIKRYVKCKLVANVFMVNRFLCGHKRLVMTETGSEAF